jgi:hypothetical protein
LSSVADAITGLGLYREYLKNQQLILYLAEVFAVTFFSNVKLDNLEVRKSSDSYELWSPKLSGIVEMICFHKIVGRGIDLSPLTSGEHLITFELAL